MRSLDVRESDKLDEKQLATWSKQAASIPGWDGGSTRSGGSSLWGKPPIRPTLAWQAQFGGSPAGWPQRLQCQPHGRCRPIERMYPSEDMHDTASSASRDPELLRRLLRAKDRIDAASHEDWPVRRLARVSRVSEAHFARSFKQAFGIPPHR